MQYMQELLRMNASQSMLYRFRADAPTTTSQRLKGLTTGSMPTFIDIGGNFNSSEIAEDNIIDQLASLNRTMYFLGDDTWEALYSGKFDVSMPFDSFNTKDLDTVDDGIERHMYDLILETRIKSNSNSKRTSINNHDTVVSIDDDDDDDDDGGGGSKALPGVPSWDLFIAHFLGVDHIGHTHHARHPLMGQRLRRMDDALKRTVQTLPEDALLLLFGDHGMTLDGNHGMTAYITHFSAYVHTHNHRRLYIA
jgi:phosphatidylinositol glycan class O